MLTGLTRLDVDDNSITELPPQITTLMNLKDFHIESESKMKIKRAPRGITNLPCWNNTTDKWSGLSIADALRKLQLYDTVDTAAEARKAEEDRKDPNSEPVTGDYADVMDIDFASLEFLGKGGFGTAYKARLKKGIVTIKVLRTEAKPGTAEYDELTKEAKLMIDLRHENIIGLYAFGCKSLRVFFVMEYADGKSIWDVVEATGALPFDKYIQYTIHINAGLKYLHSRSPPVEHRDLKPENVLLCGDTAKICDFGISSARETISRTTGFQGTFHYAAPEFFYTMKDYGPMSDMYCLALVIWAMIEGKRPYDGLSHGQITNQKMIQKLPDIPPQTPADLASLINECWMYKPRNRPSAADLEPKLIDIQKNPGAAVGEKGKSVKAMGNEELVKYLEDKKIHQDFIAVIKDIEATGEDFLQLDEKALVAAPFQLPKLQVRVIFWLIDEAKRT